MSNSPLVSYTNISPNKTVGRKHAIDTITPHCVVGQCSVETLGRVFAPTERKASSNYGIGVDGRVGMYCEEKDRSWCTSSSSNDNRAVTIECASDTTEPYAFKDVVYNKLIELCIDICKRNGKTKLLWLGDKDKTLAYTPAADEMLLTVHRWFANKSCPGNWMFSRMGDLAEKVTTALSGEATTPEEPKVEQPEETILYRVQTGAYSKLKYAVVHKQKVEAAGFTSILVKASDGLYKVQTGAFANVNNAQNLVKELKKAGFNCFITVKSGELVKDEDVAEATPTPEVIFEKLDVVRMEKNAPVYGTTKKFSDWVYTVNLYVRYINGDCITVSTLKTGAVTGNVHKKYLTKV